MKPPAPLAKKRPTAEEERFLDAYRPASFPRPSVTVDLVVFTVMALTMDNFLRPFLIKRGADLPLLLILVGVIGGLLAFGLLGLFLGPVVLAITYTLLQNWLSDADGQA